MGRPPARTGQRASTAQRATYAALSTQAMGLRDQVALPASMADVAVYALWRVTLADRRARQIVCVTRRARAASFSSALVVGAARPVAAERPKADQRDNRDHRQYCQGHGRSARELQVNRGNNEDDQHHHRDTDPAAAD